MDKQPIIFLSGIGIAGYIIFHGHRAGKDCWKCPLRGITFFGASVGLGVMLALSEKD